MSSPSLNPVLFTLFSIDIIKSMNIVSSEKYQMFMLGILRSPMMVASWSIPWLVIRFRLTSDRMNASSRKNPMMMSVFVNLICFFKCLIRINYVIRLFKPFQCVWVWV